MKKLIPLLAILLFLFSCKPVKPYQRAYLNDHEMQLGTKPLESFEDNFQSYREGASGGMGKKSGGGCGCN
ncbi:DUF4266 domain-containing protein [Rapidithrix thailandica]|uniref:DUF4266 domain-containing protein n=1 Tax=Rapidithrix thailandica TaxID=413964 RepID=A0AAW9RP17_9BACT